jgi:WD40 repeat protein
MFFVKNNSVMAMDRKGVPISISKRYPGHVRIFESNGVIHLISNGDDFSSPKQPVKVVEDIAGSQREMVLDYPISHCTDACFTEDGSCAVVGSSGLIYYQDLRRIWSIDVLNGASVLYFNGQIYFLENGISLKSIGLDGKAINNICKFGLSGSVGDFAIVDEKEYVFHLCYHDGNTAKTAIVYVKTG